MPPSVHERLRDLETDVRDLRFRPAAEVRARGRSRQRRQVGTVTAAAVLVVASAGAAVAWPRQPDPAPPLPPAAPAVSCVLTLPTSPADVKIRVVAGGAPATLVNTTINELRTRTYTVLNGTTTAEPAQAAALRYGPAAIGAATLLRAALHGDVTMRFDPARGDDTIDVILGPSFTRLASTTELNQALATAGEPTAPPECR